MWITGAALWAAASVWVTALVASATVRVLVRAG